MGEGRAMFDKDCLEKIGTGMIGLGVVGAGAVGLPVLPGLLETGVAALGLGMTLRDKQAKSTDAILKGITAEIAREAKAWDSETRSEGRDPGAVRDALASVQEVMPACLPTPEQVAPLWGKSEAVADLMLQTAQQPRFANRFTDTPGAPKDLARALFRRAALRGFSHLWTVPEFREAHAAEMRAVLLDDTAALKARLDEAQAEISNLLMRMDSKLDEVLGLLRAQKGDTATVNAFLVQEIEKARAAHDGDLAVVANLLKVLLNESVAPQNFADAIARAEAQAEALIEASSAIPNDETPELRDLRFAANEALRQRDFDEAERLRRAIRTQRRRENRRTEAADIGAIAEVQKAALRYRAAATTYAEAAATVEEADVEERWKWLLQENRSLYLLGLEFGDNAALLEAAEKADAMTRAFPCDDHPQRWAMAMGNKALALQELGEREQNAALLDEAIAAYRALLLAFDNLDDRQNWVVTQNNLGNALSVLGERENCTARFEEAVATYRTALEECPRERVPLEWAMTQNNLGAALVRIGERERDTAHLEEAVATFRSALEEHSRERVRLEWATTQNNLGNALRSLGERESGTVRFEEAVAAYRSAQEERTRERVPFYWAQTQANMAILYMTMAERTGKKADAARAVTHATDALAVYRDSGADFHIDQCEALLADCQTLQTRLLAKEGKA